MKKILSAAVAFVLGFSAVSAQDTGTDLDTLLNKVRNGSVTDTSKYKQRVNAFRTKQVQQQAELNRSNAEKSRLEKESDRLTKQRQDLDAEIARLEDLLDKEKGKLGELFGVLQQASSDAKATLENSHISVEFPNRLNEINALVDKAKDTAQLPTPDEIRTWPSAMMIEMVQSGKNVKFNQNVRLADGNETNLDIVRIGDFGFIGGGRFFVLADGGIVEELPRQPSLVLDTVAPYQAASSGLVSLGIDPTRGVIMGMEVDKATLEDQLKAGGPTGYLILALGAVGVLLSVVQFVYLFVVKAKVKSQIKNSTPNPNNPLGRVLQVYADNPNVDVETLELKLDEAILKETPALERFLTLIKLISAVAPLFGLLGTVTGMIATFQAITLFGTGDPTMMAAGISMALVTTVEGLVVAIPTLLLHSFVAGASKTVIHILEEQSAGIIAVHAEKGNS
ncbi:MotA/TolQ/ExbB proton channel family protein [Temperatibacter marinus]|uniref:MotA/TolQ/ExbB proton channel family protein n=1 Tax=Temperatibacter marinus TaxID=1456591 RepID=A0AA52ECH7_9PROT|nr:MotA/TolQ/ExbB proton channel family protein [Temperatibacter marinus]WND02882.1 MotA/TolQ/ExbB proton channel family protein [Temperatibacter marinus]